MNWVFYTLCLAFSLAESNDYLVTTLSGPVSGKYNDVEGITYVSYEGIPYGQSPTGDLRFRAPVAAQPWTETLNATVAAPVCYQEELLYTYDQMSEDCLYLNVYTPEISPSKLRNVVIFVHGGYFLWGSGNREPMFGPEKVISNDAVCVTLNYRLGSFGFLATNSSSAPGNAGLKDMCLAMQWIKNNIEYFGGDPTKITAAGVESGAIMIHYAMMNEHCSSYFTKAMMLTGNALSFRAKLTDAKKKAVIKNLANNFGITYTNHSDFVEQLKSISALDLLKYQKSMIYDAPDVAFVMNDQFVPCVETSSDTAIVTTDPLAAMQAGSFANIPLFIGYNCEDGIEYMPLIKDSTTRIENLNKDMSLCIPRDILYPSGSQDREDLKNKIKRFYFGNSNINLFIVEGYNNLITDTAYGYSADLSVELFKKKENSTIYFYQLDLDTDVYWFKVFFNITYPGASKFDSLFFNQPITFERMNKLAADTRKMAMLNEIKNYMYNFITYGEPTPVGSTNTTVHWSDAGTNRSYISMGDCPVLIPHTPHPERTQFWRDIYNQYYQWLSGTSTS